MDEVDSILIDEARTPLIISGMGEQSTQLYTLADNFAASLKGLVKATVDDKEEEADDIDADYVVDEKARTATLTARGIAKAEQSFQIENLADPENTTLSHHINQAIQGPGPDEAGYRLRGEGRRGHHRGRVHRPSHVWPALLQRPAPGHRGQGACGGGAGVQDPGHHYLPELFPPLRKLSGMTGTAMTEEEEFNATYQLDIVEVPTNKPLIRVDHPDEVYKNTTGKYHAIVRQIAACHEKGQPSWPAPPPLKSRRSSRSC